MRTVVHSSSHNLSLLAVPTLVHRLAVSGCGQYEMMLSLAPTPNPATIAQQFTVSACLCVQVAS